MSNNFDMIGTIKLGDDALDIKTFDKSDGSVNTLKVLKFDIKCGEDNFKPRIQGWGGDTIYTLDKTFKKLTFKAKDYKDYLDEIASFKKFYFSDDKERVAFAREFEFIDYVNDKLSSGAYEGRLVKIGGELRMTSYTDKEGNFRTFTNYEVQRVHIANEKDEINGEVVVPHAKANMTAYLDSKSLVLDKLDENKLEVVYYVGEYDKKKKDAGMHPEIGFMRTATFNLDEDPYKRDRQLQALESKMLRVDDDYLTKTGFVVNLINRGGKVEFNETMLTEEEKEDIELGLTTLEDVIKEHSFGMGEYISGEEISSFKQAYRKGGTETLEITLNDLLRSADEINQQEFEIVDYDDIDDLFGGEEPPF